MVSISAASVGSPAWMTSNSLLSAYIGAQLCNTGLMSSYIADVAIVSSSQASLWKFKIKHGVIPHWAAFWKHDKKSNNNAGEQHSTGHPCNFFRHPKWLVKLPPHKRVSESEFPWSSAARPHPLTGSNTKPVSRDNKASFFSLFWFFTRWHTFHFAINCKLNISKKETFRR